MSKIEIKLTEEELVALRVAVADKLVVVSNKIKSHVNEGDIALAKDSSIDYIEYSKLAAMLQASSQINYMMESIPSESVNNTTIQNIDNIDNDSEEPEREIKEKTYMKR